MNSFAKSIGIILILLSLLFAQSGNVPAEGEIEYRSIHQIQSEFYSGYRSFPDRSIPASDISPLISRKTSTLSREVFGYLPYWEYSTYSQLHYDLLSVIAYFGAGINSHGGITNDHDWPASGLINMAHQHGVKVVLTATLFSSGDIQTLLSNQTYRTNCVNNLLTRVLSANADGVNIDFEGVPSSQRGNMVLFMQELSDSFRTNIEGAHISMATPAVDWSNAWDYNTLANICDALFIMGYAYHWGGSSNTGPVAPLTGWGTYNITWTVNDYLNKTGNNGGKIILGVPYYGFEWPCVSGDPGAATTGSGSAQFYAEAESRANSFGKLWDSASQTPWYHFQSGGWHQGWYDDSLSLSLKYDLAKSSDLLGVGMWALGYDGSRPELWGALRDAFGESNPPLKPEWLAVRNAGDGTVAIIVSPVIDADQYQVFISSDGVSFDSLLASQNNLIIIDNLQPDSIYYFKVRTANEMGVSGFGEVGAVGTVSSYAPVLIVNGFDRINGTVNTFDFVRYHGPEILSAGYGFDFASNEALTDNALSIFDYAAIDWISGEEGVETSSFNPSEQILIKAYLKAGGSVFVSGSEIGYDLVENSSSSDDIIFYQDFLKADYITDRVNTHRTTPSVNTIFPGIEEVNFDDGTHGTYDVDYPDGIKPQSGAFRILEYSEADYETEGCAGIAYTGIFGNGNSDGAIIYLAFPFETVYDSETRLYLMERIMNFLVSNSSLSVTESIPAESDLLISNYPNPANPGTNFLIRGSGLKDGEKLTIKIFDILGKLVYQKKLYSDDAILKYSWDGRNTNGQKCSTGIYFLHIYFPSEGITKVHKFTVLK